MPQGTGFVNWADVFRLNQPQAQSMADGVSSDVRDLAPDVNWAMTADRKGKQLGVETDQYGGPQAPENWEELFRQADEANRGAGLTKTTGGLMGLLDKHYGPSSSAGNSLFDAALTGRAGAGQFEGLRKDYDSAVGRINQMPRTQTPPVERRGTQYDTPPDAPEQHEALRTRLEDAEERRRRRGAGDWSNYQGGF